MKNILKTLIPFIIVALYATPTLAVPLNATNIGGMWTTTPISTAASQALTGFRGAFTPMNVGMAVGTYVIISTIGDGVRSLQMQMGSNLPALQRPKPAGWVDDNTPSATTTPSPHTGLYGCSGSDKQAVSQCSLDAYKQNNGCSGQTSGWCVNAVLGADDPALSRWLVINSGGVISSVAYSTNVCPAGYTAGAPGVCNLTNAANVKWPSDGVPTMQHNGTNFIPHPRDPDAPLAATSPTYSRTGKDSYQNPVKESLTVNPAGGVDYQRDSESISPVNGEPTVQRDKFSTDSTGQVLNTSSQQFLNSTLSNVQTNNFVSNTSGSQTDVSALSKESTQLQIKDLLTPGTEPDTTHVQDSVDALGNGIVTDTNAVPKDLSHNPADFLEIPHYWDYASGECFPAQFNAGKFGTISLASFCQIYDDHIRSLIVFMLGVWACLHVFGYWRETIIQSLPQ